MSFVISAVTTTQCSMKKLEKLELTQSHQPSGGAPQPIWCTSSTRPQSMNPCSNIQLQFSYQGAMVPRFLVHKSIIPWFHGSLVPCLHVPLAHNSMCETWSIICPPSPGPPTIIPCSPLCMQCKACSTPCSTISHQSSLSLILGLLYAIPAAILQWTNIAQWPIAPGHHGMQRAHVGIHHHRDPLASTMGGYGPLWTIIRPTPFSCRTTVGPRCRGQASRFRCLPGSCRAARVGLCRNDRLLRMTGKWLHLLSMHAGTIEEIKHFYLFFLLSLAVGAELLLHLNFEGCSAVPHYSINQLRNGLLQSIHQN